MNEGQDFLGIDALIAPAHPPVEVGAGGQAARADITDDLALALQPENPDILLLGGAAESPLADSLIDRYLQQHLQIRVNGEAASLHYLSKEADPEVVWCYVEAIAACIIDTRHGECNLLELPRWI